MFRHICKFLGGFDLEIPNFIRSLNFYGSSAPMKIGSLGTYGLWAKEVVCSRVWLWKFNLGMDETPGIENVK